MSDNEELKTAVIDWFQKHSKPGKTKFYMRDVINDLVGQYDKRSIQKAINDCTVDGTLKYWSTGSTTLFCLPENFSSGD